ncbi:Acyl-[acyl-carrier-protein]--UDP-N-acetylglucosamine O-acyltransferase [compost metagenome]
MHVAHDCQVGNNTILANNATLAGHVQVADWAIIGGLTGVHQFSKVGAHVMAGFASHISQDVPPFTMVDGHPLAVRGLNLEGLRRRGFSAERLAVIKQVYRVLYRSGLTLQAAVDALQNLHGSCEPEAQADVQLMLDFLAQSTRGIVR